MADAPQMRIGALTISATRPQALGRFYSRLLSWPYLREEEPKPGNPDGTGFAITCPPEEGRGPALNFEYDPHFRRPTWPSVAGEQTIIQHLDIGVDDLESAVAWAIECGAEPAQLQPQPAHYRVLLDPEGHPFCLCQS
jgi:catechol 2,3-dioxygenase-like lactoylglutathione lyase family enzyme